MRPGGLFWHSHSAKVKMASAKAGEQKTAAATLGTLTSELTSSGTISPKDTYTITSLVEGTVLTADFEEGDQVTEGQVLYQIDASSVESDLKSSENPLARANKSYQQALEEYQEAVSDYSGNTYKSTRTGFIKKLNIQVGDKVGSNTDLAELYNDQIMKLKVSFLAGEAAGHPGGKPGRGYTDCTPRSSLRAWLPQSATWMRCWMAGASFATLPWRWKTREV